MGALVLSGNTLYGATTQGGASGGGTVFAINTGGTGFKVLHAFTALDNGTNSDGSYAQDFFMNGTYYSVEQNPGLVLSDGTLFGTTASGGIWGGGTVFAVNINGSGFTNLHSFNPTNSDGHYPLGGLVLSGHRLYGTTGLYGTAPPGNVFTIGTDGTGFTNVHTFSYSDGVGPNGLTLSGDTLFGTTYVGGGSPFSTPYGTVFSLQADGTNFKVLYNFSNGSDGDPRLGVVVSGGNVYGSTPGLLFKVSADGAGFWVLHRFENTGGLGPSALIVSGNTLYGTTLGSGSAGGGTLFAVNTDGTGFTNLYTFTPASPSGGFSPFSYTNSQGANPAGELVLSGTTFYGTTQIGGSGGSGTVFKIFFPPQLSILPAGPDLILTWPTNAVGFTLQLSTNLFSQTAWTDVPQSPIILNGQNLVIVPTSGAGQFYRLKQ